MTHSPLPLLRRLARSRLGSSAVEFVAMTPVIGIMMFATIDLGNVLYTRFRLNAAVAAGANYALSRAADVATNAADIDTKATAIVANTTGTGWAVADVVVNNNTAQCYCPTTATVFGATATCGSACGGGGLAGKFVRVSASRPFSAMVTDFGATTSGNIVATSVVQTE